MQLDRNEAEKEIQAVKPYVSSVQEDELLDKKNIYEIIEYQVLDMEKVDQLVVDKAPAADQKKLKAEITTASEGSAQKALATMAIFPLIMLLAYIAMWFYFKSKGGYRPVELEVQQVPNDGESPYGDG